MKVFISWSGPRSKVVAEALGYWLPKVLQAVRTFVSTNSIDKGTRWRSIVANELEQSSFGIVCLTPENLTAPWILFEAGALSKQQKDNVCTVLYDVEPTDFGDPLSQFQTTKIDKDDVKDLVKVINRVNVDASLTETDLEETFEVWWPKFEERLTSIPKSQALTDPKRPERELLEDILTTVRAMQRERNIKNQTSTAFMLQYMHLLGNAIQNDPKLASSPDMPRILNDLRDILLSEDVEHFIPQSPKVFNLSWRSKRKDYPPESTTSIADEKTKNERLVQKPEDTTNNADTDS
jgi:hypothetical protein